MFYYSVSPFAYNSLYIIFKSIIIFVCLNKLFMSLVTMNHFCKTYAETDLTLLHYITFIKPLAICPTEALSFDSDQFMNNSINKVIEEKKSITLLCSLKNISSLLFWCIKNLMNYNSKICRTKFSNSSQNHKVRAKIFVNNKFYHVKFILTIFLLKICILNIT
jgi:hypothetical protein